MYVYIYKKKAWTDISVCLLPIYVFPVNQNIKNLIYNELTRCKTYLLYFDSIFLNPSGLKFIL